MNCKKCGAPLGETDQFCKNCGATVNVTENDNNQQIVVESLGQQPMNNQQVNYNSQPLNGGNISPTKSNNNLKYIIVGIVIVVVVFGLVAVLGLKMFNNNYTKNNGYSNNNSSNNTGITNTSSTSSYKVRFNDFTFSVPDNMIYQQNTNSLLIGDEANTWAAQLEIGEGNYSQLKANKGQMATILQQHGYNCTAATEKTFGGVEFITMEMSTGGTNAIAAFARINSMYFTAITAMSQDNEFNYKILENIAPIISSAELTTVSNSISSNTQLDMSGFEDLAK